MEQGFLKKITVIILLALAFNVTFYMDTHNGQFPWDSKKEYNSYRKIYSEFSNSEKVKCRSRKCKKNKIDSYNTSVYMVDKQNFSYRNYKPEYQVLYKREQRI